MVRFLESLFESNFMPHGQCMLWRSDLLWLHGGSDALIALSYYIVPPLLVYFVYKREDLAFKWMFVLFGTFIMACGTTHLVNIWTLWNGTYWLEGFLKLGTGAVSFVTAILLVPLIPKALELPTPSQLQKANQALQAEIEERKKTEQALAERTQELDEANKKLRKTQRMKDEFFANVSHELRTPLTLILSPVDSLLDGRYGRLKKQQQKVLHTTHSNAIRMLQMVNGLLDFSQLEIGEVKVNREPVDIDKLTRSIVGDFEPLMREKGLAHQVEVSPTGAVVQIDRYLYERILFNLLSNAVKFTSDQETVTVSVEHADDQLRLLVSDTGMGIEQEKLEHIFEDFRQVDASATRRFEGTGLGLALVKEFSELLNGYVTVESEPRVGSTFQVVCQAAAQSANGQEIQSSKRNHVLARQFEIIEEEEQKGHNGITVEKRPDLVLAEDNLELARYITNLLREICCVHHARTGDKALELVEKVKPEVVITDVMMPKRDGLDLCRVLKECPETTRIPVVILTALTNRKALLQGWKAGADEYLFKPFHPKEIVTRIRTLLVSIQQRQEAEVKLKKSEEQFSRVFESAPMGASITTLEKGCFVNINKRFEQITGYAVEDVTGTQVQQLNLFYDPVLYSELTEKFRQHQRIDEREIKIVTASGEVREVVLTATVVTVEDTPCLLSMFYDTTERNNLERRLLGVRDEERRRIGHDLHDGLGQVLSGASLLTHGLIKDVQNGRLVRKENLEEINGLITEAVSFSRRLTHRIIPVNMDASGLLSSLERLAAETERRFGIDTAFKTKGTVLVFDNSVATNLYRIAQEAVHKVVQQPKATHLTIHLWAEDDQVHMKVEGDGVVFSNEDEGADGLGVDGMRYHSRFFDGKLSIQESGSDGAFVYCAVTNPNQLPA